MTKNEQQKEAFITGIILRLSKTYRPESHVSRRVGRALKKLSLQEISSLHAMVLTSTKK